MAWHGALAFRRKKNVSTHMQPILELFTLEKDAFCKSDGVSGFGLYESNPFTGNRGRREAISLGQRPCVHRCRGD
jgi:hypothetical protein